MISLHQWFTKCFGRYFFLFSITFKLNMIIIPQKVDIHKFYGYYFVFILMVHLNFMGKKLLHYYHFCDSVTKQKSFHLYVENVLLCSHSSVSDLCGSVLYVCRRFLIRQLCDEYLWDRDGGDIYYVALKHQTRQ